MPESVRFEKYSARSPSTKCPGSIFMFKLRGPKIADSDAEIIDGHLWSFVVHQAVKHAHCVKRVDVGTPPSRGNTRMRVRSEHCDLFICSRSSGKVFCVIFQQHDSFFGDRQCRSCRFRDNFPESTDPRCGRSRNPILTINRKILRTLSSICCSVISPHRIAGRRFFAFIHSPDGISRSRPYSSRTQCAMCCSPV